MIVSDRISLKLVLYSIAFFLIKLRKVKFVLLGEGDGSLKVYLARLLTDFRMVDFDLADCTTTCKLHPFIERENYLLEAFTEFSGLMKLAFAQSRADKMVKWSDFQQFLARYVLFRDGESVAKCIIARHLLLTNNSIDLVFLDENIMSRQLKETYPRKVCVLAKRPCLQGLGASVFRYLWQIWCGASGWVDIVAKQGLDVSAKKRIAIQYVHGFHNQGWGTDWDWFEHSRLDYKDVVYLAENELKVRDEDVEKARKVGVEFKFVKRKFFAKNNEVIVGLFGIISFFYVLFFSASGRTFVSVFLSYFSIFCKWKYLFKAAGVYGYVNVGDANFDAIPKIHAIESIGGVNLSYEFSATGFQSYFDACPTGKHQYLMWGSLSKRILEDSAGKVPYRLSPKCFPFAGNMKLHLQFSKTRKQEEMVKNIKCLGFEKTVLIADSTPTHLKLTSSRNLEKFYDAILPLVEEHSDTLFVIKPQNASALSEIIHQKLAALSNRKNVFLILEPLGLTHFLLPLVDVVIGAPVYASLIFEALAAGKRTICFDCWRFPHVVREVHSKGSLVTSSSELMQAFDKAIRGEFDQDKLRRLIEPYGDSRGHVRFGAYLGVWFDSLNEFGSADAALGHVMKRYDKACNEVSQSVGIH